MKVQTLHRPLILYDKETEVTEVHLHLSTLIKSCEVVSVRGSILTDGVDANRVDHRCLIFSANSILKSQQTNKQIQAQP